MTYDEETHEIVAGQIFYGWRKKHIERRSRLYFPVTTNKSALNDEMCGRFNRGGRLCGGCKTGYSPLVYSYDLHCRACSASESKQNWVKYTLVAFVPLTVFCVFVILSKFNANTPALHIIVLGGQMLTAPILMRYLMAQYDNTLFRLVAGLLGVWNLDFFRSFYPDMCLNLTLLNALLLDYVIDFYPLFLIFLIYMCVASCTLKGTASLYSCRHSMVFVK